jgi:hypothetical protein
MNNKKAASHKGAGIAKDLRDAARPGIPHAFCNSGRKRRQQQAGSGQRAAGGTPVPRGGASVGAAAVVTPSVTGAALEPLSVTEGGGTEHVTRATTPESGTTNYYYDSSASPSRHRLRAVGLHRV